MHCTLLPEHHTLLSSLIDQGAGLTLTLGGPTLPLGGAIFQSNPQGWDLVWVQLWPDSPFAVHRQSFDHVATTDYPNLRLLDEFRVFRGVVKALDARELQDCRWGEWIADTDSAARSRKLADHLLRAARADSQEKSSSFRF